MQELLEKLKSLDPTTYKQIEEALWAKEIAEETEYVCDEYGHRCKLSMPDCYEDAILQACLQEAISGKGWFFYIQWDIHYGWLASINDQEEPCEGDSPAKSLLAAYIAACEAKT